MTFKTFTIFASLIAITTIAQAQKFNLLIGTYTNSGKSEGIYVYEFDSRTGTFSYKNKTTDIKDPNYLAISADYKHVYSVSSDMKGSTYAYKFDPITGNFAFQNKIASGEGPCYVSTDSKGKDVFIANYNSGSLAAIALKQDGSLSENIQLIGHQGSSIDKSRQTKPYVHSAVISPDEKYLFVQDLGTDKINCYKIDFKNVIAPLSPSSQPFVKVGAGSGPRHLTFHPNKKFAYLIQEMGGLVSAFSYKNGTLIPIETVPTGDKDFKGELRSADIHISPDGKFLYGSNRGTANEIVIFSINEKSGRLTYAGRQSTIGKTPRNFAIDPTGNYLLAANQDTDDIYVFKRNKQTGLLAFTGTKLEIGRPVCLKFIP